MGGHSRDQGRHTIYIYIYKREKKTERRKDTEANIEKGKGLNHICAVM